MDDETLEVDLTKRRICGPIVCPVCWDHELEPIDGVRMSARTITEHDVSRVSVYRCSAWHMFAVFDQTL
jgi:hypothetical protein